MPSNEQLPYGRGLIAYDNAPKGYQWTLSAEEAEARIAKRNAELDAHFADMKQKAALQQSGLHEVGPMDNEINLPTVSTDGPRVVTGDITIFEFVQTEAVA